MNGEKDNNKVIFIIEMILTGCFLCLGVLILVVGSTMKKVPTPSEEIVVAAEPEVSSESKIEESTKPENPIESTGIEEMIDKQTDLLPKHEISQEEDSNLGEVDNLIYILGGTLNIEDDGSVFYNNTNLGYWVLFPSAYYVSYEELPDGDGVQLITDDDIAVTAIGGYDDFEGEVGTYEYSEATEDGTVDYYFNVFGDRLVSLFVSYTDDKASVYGMNTRFGDDCKASIKIAGFEDGGAASDQQGWESEYMLPYSDIAYVYEADLIDFTAWGCKIARNEIYARHGRLFKDQELQDYFNSLSWYVGYISPDEFEESMLSEIERANVQTITAYEKKMGYR